MLENARLNHHQGFESLSVQAVHKQKFLVQRLNEKQRLVVLEHACLVKALGVRITCSRVSEAHLRQMRTYLKQYAPSLGCRSARNQNV